MSPEICENKPYTYKSDVWSLGCVLYELCTLEHAFCADNLLGLVYKIVQDKHAPIPETYSDELKLIVEALLQKDGDKRPLVSDILMTPFAKKKMEEFITNGGFVGEKKLQPRKIRSRTSQSDSQNSDYNSTQHTYNEDPKLKGRSKSHRDNYDSGLTPKQRMLLDRQRRADQEADKLKTYAKGAIQNYSNAQQRKYEEFYSGKEPSYNKGKYKSGHKSHRVEERKHTFDEDNHQYNRTSGHPVIGEPKNVMVSNYCANPIDERAELEGSKHDNPHLYKQPNSEELHGSKYFGDSFAANDRCEETYTPQDPAEDTFAANDREEETMRSATKFGASRMTGSNGADTFKLSESNGTMISGLSLESSSAKTLTKPIQKHVSHDDRKIVASGKYDPEEYYYNYEKYESDEFEDDEDTTPGSTQAEAEKDPQELTSIVDNYKHFLKEDKQEVEEEKDAEFKAQQEKFNKEVNKMEDLPIKMTAQLQMQNNKTQIKQALGVELYEKVYSFLKEERRKETDDRKIQQRLRKMLPKDKRMLSKCSDLDQIVVMELLRGE